MAIKSLPASNNMSISLLLFIIICISFLLSASTYFKLREYKEPKSDEVESAKTTSFWTMLLSGISVIMFVYLVLYHKPEKNEMFQFLGCEMDTCSDGPTTLD